MQILFSVGREGRATMNWKHPRDETKAASKERETESGTRWSFIAAAGIVA